MNIEELRSRILKINGRYWYKELTQEEIDYIFSVTNFLPEKYDIKIRRIYFIHGLTELKTCPTCGKEISWDRKHQKFGERCSKDCLLVPIGVSMDKVFEQTSFLPESTTFKNRIGYFKLNITEFQKCIVCGEEINYDNKHRTFSKHCSKECRTGDNKYIDSINIKRKETWENKSKNEIESINEKRKTTVQEKWGTDNVFQNETIIVKSNETRINTYQEKYGVDYVFQTDDFKEKKTNTLIEKYDVDNPMKNEDLKKKQQDSLERNYGVRNPMKSKIIQQKQIDNCNEKHGTDYIFQSDEFKKQYIITQRTNYYNTFLLQLKQKQIEPLFTREEYIKLDYDISPKKYKCLKCNKEFENNKMKIQKIYCPYHQYKSQAELDIKEWILSEKSDIEIIMNKRLTSDGKSMELDLYLPDFNLGIEYHGLYWHSDVHKEKGYHKDKYDFFKKQGITVIQIFENEWSQQQEIVKSIIRTKLSLIERKLYGRKCTIRTLENDEYKQFCELNHIQGYGIAKYRLGLYHEDELVQIMSFSSPRFNKDYDLENIRTCTKINTVVVGGFSKLLKHFKSLTDESIISYVDVRYFTGGGYLSNGFDFKNHSEPNFFYFKKEQNPILESRHKYQKHKLETVLDIYDSNITAYENMLNNKFLRIFDAGNLVLVSK